MAILFCYHGNKQAEEHNYYGVYLLATVWGDLTKAFSVSVTLLVGLILVPL